MPHLVIEHGNALNTLESKKRAMQLGAKAMSECGFISEKDIKVRIRDCEDFLFLDGRESFIHCTVRMLAGRSDDQKESLTIALREEYEHAFPNVSSLSFEVCDMCPASYKKRLA